MTLLQKTKTFLLGVCIVFGVMAHGNQAKAAGTETLTVAGGCFWCVESDFEKVKGVKEVVSGYTGGSKPNPTYKQVTSGRTGHFEAVQIQFDPSVISRQTLLSMFLRSVDPTDAGGQFCDRGDSYKTAIFVSNAGEKALAEQAVSRAQSDLGQKVVTPVLNANEFFPAEAYHQDYYKGMKIVLTRFGPKKQSAAYKAYRNACGRDQRVRELWGTAAPFAG